MAEQFKLNMSGHPNLELEKMGFLNVPLQVDISDPKLPDKLKVLLQDKIPAKSGQIMVVMPGLAPLCNLIMPIIHGITGQFPEIVIMKPGLERGTFIPQDPVDLQKLRLDSRRERDGMIDLT